MGHGIERAPNDDFAANRRRIGTSITIRSLAGAIVVTAILIIFV